MKEEKPKLALNKRTIARLNNLEMRHVRGGDGEGTPTRKGCGDPEKDKDTDIVIKEVTRTIVSLLVKVC